MGLPGTVSNMLERFFFRWRGAESDRRRGLGQGVGALVELAQLNVQPAMARNEANSLLQ